MASSIINVQNPEETQGWGSGADEGWDEIGETPNSPGEEYTMDGTTIRRNFLVPYLFRRNFAVKMCGFPFIGADGKMYRHLPAAHPEHLNIENEPYLFATKVSYQGYVNRGQAAGVTDEALIDNEYVQATVTYETLPYKVLSRYRIMIDGEVDESKRFVRKVSKSAGEFLTTETGVWLWWDESPSNGDGTSTRFPKINKQPVSTRIGVWQGLRHITYTWFDVHPDGWDRVRAEELVGQTNNEIFDEYAKETLLLTGVNVVPRQSPIGIPLEEVTFEFIHKAVGINRYLHPIGEYLSVIGKFPELPAPLSQDEIDAGLEFIRKPIQAGSMSVLFKPPF